MSSSRPRAAPAARWRRRAWIAGIVVAVVIAILVAQRHAVFLSSRFAFVPELWGMGEMAVVTLATADGLRLDAWYAPPDPGRGTVLFFPGARGHLGLSDYRMKPFLERGMGVLMVGYRGYGSNAGTPSERGLYRDAAAAVEFLKARGIASAGVLFYGFSLGTAIAIHTAAEQPAVAGVVLEAPLKSMADLARHHWVFLPKPLMRYRFDSYAKVARIAAPLLILHGTADRVVPASHAQALYRQAAPPKCLEIIEGADHNDIFERGGEARVLRFQGRLGPDGPDPCE